MSGKAWGVIVLSVISLVIVSTVAIQVFGAVGSTINTVPKALELLAGYGYTAYADPIGDMHVNGGDLWTRNIYPNASNTYDIGSNTYKFRAGYFSTLNAPVSKGYSYVFAASNATASEKAQADAILTGTADDILINAQFTAITGDIKILGATVNVANTINIGELDSLALSANTSLVATANVDVVKLYRQSKLEGGWINTSGVGGYNKAAITFDITDRSDPGNERRPIVKDTHLKGGVNEGTAILIKVINSGSDNAVIPEATSFYNISIEQFNKGVHLWGAATGGSSISHINDLFFYNLTTWHTTYSIYGQNDDVINNDMAGNQFLGFSVDGSQGTNGGIFWDGVRSTFIGKVEAGSSNPVITLTAKSQQNNLSLVVARDKISNLGIGNIITSLIGETSTDTGPVFDFGGGDFYNITGTINGLVPTLPNAAATANLGVISDNYLLASHIGIVGADYIFPMKDGSGASVADISGNGKVLSLTHSPTWGTLGRLGNLTFDGTNDYASTSVDETIGGDLTLIFSLTPNFANTDSLVHYLFSASVGGHYILIYEGGDNDLYMDVNGGTAHKVINGTIAFGSGDKIVVIAVKNETTDTITLYANGTQLDTTTGFGALTATATHNYFFRGLDGGDPKWGGGCSLIARLDYALTVQDVDFVTDRVGGLVGLSLP